MFSLLIVEDNPNDRKGIVELISWDELDVYVAGIAVNGLDGYEKAIELRPDFILTDLAMPYMNGLEMTEKIKRLLPDTGFIFMSCFDDFEYMQGAINNQVTAYILKPINLEELSSAIYKVVQNKKALINKYNNELMIKKMLNESLPFFQEQFLKELIYRNFEDELSIMSRAEYLKMDFSYTYYAVLYVQIDNYALLYSQTSAEDKHSMIFGLQKIVEQCILNRVSGYAVNNEMNSIVTLIFFKDQNQAEALDILSELTNNCIEQVNALMNIDVTIGISHFESKLSSAASMFKNAEAAAHSKFYTKGNRIIFSSEVEEPGTSNIYNLQTIKQEILSFLESGEGTAESIINRYLGSNNSNNEKYCKSFAYTVMNILQIVLIENNMSFGDLFEDEIIIWKKLSLFETIFDIRQLLINIICAVKDALENDNTTGYMAVVEEIKKIIEKDYHKINNINQIMEHIPLSASYANFLFKQQTGQTIFDYLTWKRVEIAKEMLRDPYIKIYEIPEKVGYKTNSHFRSVFKQLTGKTPKQYQEFQSK